MTRAASITLNIALLLGLAEGCARLAEALRPAQEDVGLDYAPYRMQRMIRAPWTLNRDGFRAAELESYRGKFLVEFLGGSVCLGVGTNPGKPLPQRLEEALHAAGLANAAVINLCQGGVASAQELAIFVQYGLPLKPQVVLSFDGANDLLHPRPLGEDGDANLPYQDREMKARFDGHHGWFEHFAVKRVADRVAQRLPMPVRTFAALGPDVAPASIIESYLYVSDVIRTLTEAQQGLYALLLQPTLHYAKPMSVAERSGWTGRRSDDAEVASGYAAGLFEQTRTALTAWSEKNHAPVYDLTHTFRETPGTVYSDSVHFTGETGFRMLEEELERQGIVARITSRYRDWETEQSGLHPISRTLAWQR
ncbi:MAG: hypothetical protein ABI811_05250 [Acidobacteriota bacterium]